MNGGAQELTSAALRRLAAYVQGCPATGQFWLVVVKNQRGLYDVEGGQHGFFGSEADATNHRVTAGKQFIRVVGPLLKDAQEVRFTEPKIGSLEITRGSANTPVNPDLLKNIDLICLTESAFHKFIAPYYYTLYGATLESAEAVKKLLLARTTATHGIWVHPFGTFLTPTISPEDQDVFIAI
jgi:hypothetical protein